MCTFACHGKSNHVTKMNIGFQRVGYRLVTVRRILLELQQLIEMRPIIDHLCYIEVYTTYTD